MRITHPFHPQLGQELDFIVRRTQWGEDRIFYRSREGHMASLPARWTSMAAQDPVAEVGTETLFRVEDLLALVAVVARLRS